MSSRTLASVSGIVPHRSFFHDRIRRLAGDRPLDEWLVEQANARGFHGAIGLTRADAVDERVAPEELLAGLLLPEAAVDVRLFRLAVRMMQSGRLDARRAVHLARQERVVGVLWWLLERVPDSERNAHLRAFVAAIEGPPRGYRPLAIEYDARRLVHRPFAGFRR